MNSIVYRTPKVWLLATAGGALLTAASWAADYQGWAKVDIFTPINGGIFGLQERIRTNNNPDLVTFINSLYWSRTPGADNYGARISGFLTPIETADYVFFVAADDNTSLYLSTDSTPANLKLVAADQGWQNSRTWTGPGGYDANRGGGGYDRGDTNGNGPFENRSDQFLNSPRTNLLTGTSVPWPTTDASGNAVINLRAGQKYYFELLYNEGTGGENTGVAWKKATDPDPANGSPEIGGEFLSVDYGTTLTFYTQPQSQIVSVNQPVSFTVFVVGVPGDSDQTTFVYEWLVNGQPVPDQPNGPTYSILAPTLADSGKKFSVKVTTVGGIIGTSAEATLTVVSDNTPPAITKIHSSDTFVSAIVTFSEAVQDSAVDPANYVITGGGGLTVTDANFGIVKDPNNDQDPKSPTDPANRLQVILTTTKQTEGAVYDVTMNNIKDITGNTMTAKTAKIYANVFQAGQWNYKRWDRGTSLSSLINDPWGAVNAANALRYPFPTAEETRTTGSTGNYLPGVYVDRVDGFFIPPVTTNYVFYISADNDGYLYLSTDSDPVNRKMIAADVGWQNTAQWTGPGGQDTARGGGGYDRGDEAGNGPFENRSDEMLTSQRALNGSGLLNGVTSTDGTDPDPWPTTDANGNAVISLTAGQRYYIQLWHVEGDSGRAEITYKYSGDSDPANGTASRFASAMIGSWVDPIGFPPTITTQPTNINFNVGDTLNFNVVATSPLPPTYQWYKNQGALSGKTTALLTIPNAQLTDIGSYYVVVANVNGTATSQAAAALPITPVTPPHKTFQEDATGLTSIEAENYYDAVAGTDGHVWFPVSGRADASGNAHVAVLPDGGVNYGNTDMNRITNGPRLDFRINFNAAGTHYLWLRGGDSVPSGAGDSVHAGIDRALTVVQLTGTPGFTINPGWNWVGAISDNTTRATVNVPSAGIHTVSLWMREDGFSADKLVLTTDSTYTPTGNGPAESQLVAGGPTISVTRNASGGIVINYTGTLVSSPTVNGTYDPVAGASGGSYTVDPQGAQKFFRSKQ